jgi:ATP-dependent Clp protease protease subunit
MDHLGNEFVKYATKHHRINDKLVNDFVWMHGQPSSYLTPNIIEERRMNAVAMDVFSRLMMDRIIFLGVPIYEDVANIIQAQLLFLESTDAKSDIQIYINSPGGSVSAQAWLLPWLLSLCVLAKKVKERRCLMPVS